MDSTFGKRLRSARVSLKLTQKELASQIGVKHNSISDWENDKNKPDPDTIELLCGVLEMSPNYLLGLHFESSVSPSELEIIKKYRDLDDHGKEMVDIILEKEFDRTKQNDAKDYLTPIAAHNDNAADEEQQRLMQKDIDEL